MVGRFFRTLKCFEYEGNYPTISLKLTNCLGETKGFDFKIDTGYSGGIMVSREDYEFFACGELPRSLWRSYSTIIGIIPMKTARAFVQIDELNTNFEVYVETPVYGVGRRLIGREVINRLILLLNGPEKRSCICKTA